MPYDVLGVDRNDVTDDFHRNVTQSYEMSRDELEMDMPQSRPKSAKSRHRGVLESDCLDSNEVNGDTIDSHQVFRGALERESTMFDLRPKSAKSRSRRTRSLDVQNEFSNFNGVTSHPDCFSQTAPTGTDEKPQRPKSSKGRRREPTAGEQHVMNSHPNSIPSSSSSSSSSSSPSISTSRRVQQPSCASNRQQNATALSNNNTQPQKQERPKSAWKNRVRRPNFSSLDIDSDLDLDAEIETLDLNDNSQGASCTRDDFTQKRQTRTTGSRSPVLALRRKSQDETETMTGGIRSSQAAWEDGLVGCQGNGGGAYYSLNSPRRGGYHGNGQGLTRRQSHDRYDQQLQQQQQQQYKTGAHNRHSFHGDYSGDTGTSHEEFGTLGAQAASRFPQRRSFKQTDKKCSLSSSDEEDDVDLDEDDDQKESADSKHSSPRDGITARAGRNPSPEMLGSSPSDKGGSPRSGTIDQAVNMQSHAAEKVLEKCRRRSLPDRKSHPPHYMPKEALISNMAGTAKSTRNRPVMPRKLKPLFPRADTPISTPAEMGIPINPEDEIGCEASTKLEQDWSPEMDPSLDLTKTIFTQPQLVDRNKKPSSRTLQPIKTLHIGNGDGEDVGYSSSTSSENLAESTSCRDGLRKRILPLSPLTQMAMDNTLSSWDSDKTLVRSHSEKHRKQKLEPLPENERPRLGSFSDGVGVKTRLNTQQ